MAFKSKTFSKKVAVNPAAHFKTLTKRQFPDVMPHQKDMLEKYAAQFEGSSDVALQLPTGSGKTLVGLLIADWRRIKHGDRTVYLCPTKQLVRQTVFQAKNQYGIDVVDLSGSKKGFDPTDRAAYKTGSKIAISTYSGLFNTHPFFDDANIILVDDAHAAENYIANMWSLVIQSGTPLHDTLAEFLSVYISPQEYSRLTGDWVGTADATWIEKLPSPLVRTLAPDLISIIDAHATIEQPDIHFKWLLLRDHLSACHVYLASKEILIRPLMPPTSTHAPFHKADQRIFMSATLGIGGDLERLTGRKKIDRLPAPEGFQSSGVGRRFFIFPTLSLTSEDTDSLRLEMQKKAGRSVVLTPSSHQAQHHAELIGEHLAGFTVFDKDDIEEDKAQFSSTDKAVAILANRYDGIDFPGDECRLLCVDGLPRAMNAQERFIMSKMGASALYNDRVQTRVLQAMGRCTRALQDRSAVIVTGTELVDFLSDDRNWKYFPAELHAELYFGVEQSKDVSADEFLENFHMFMENGAEWSEADGEIRGATSHFDQVEYPAMSDLESVVSREIAYQEAMWHEDYSGALAAARDLLGNLNHEKLQGYRAMWHYLAGSAANCLSNSPGDAHAFAAKEHFLKAKSAAPAISWLNTLSRTVGDLEADDSAGHNPETLLQVECLERLFTSMGTATNHKFDKRAAKVKRGLEDSGQFEPALVALGELIGLKAGNDESDAAPDPWWLGDQTGIVYEANAAAEESSVFGANKARQASSHPKWIKKNVPGANSMDIFAVLITPCIKAKSGADPHLEGVRYWQLDKFKQWATHALTVIRHLKGSFPGESDLVWRSEAAQRLETEGMTLTAILSQLPIATEAMEIVP